MIFLPPKVVQEQYLRPAGLPDELIDEIPCPRWVGPGFTNPMFPKPVVEQFVEERRPKSLDKKSYGEEEDFKVVAANGTDVLERIASALEELATRRGVETATATSPVVEMLTPAQAAKQMKLHVQTVREWCRDEDIPFGTKSGRKWLISPDEVRQYLRGQLLIKGRVAG
jgi:excisionase family DNA binding protein